MLGIGAALGVVAFLIFRIRSILPVGLIKLGVSLFQIIASGSTSYAIPWYVVQECGRAVVPSTSFSPAYSTQSGWQ